jgi:hypothetical protein
MPAAELRVTRRMVVRTLLGERDMLESTIQGEEPLCWNNLRSMARRHCSFVSSKDDGDGDDRTTGRTTGSSFKFWRFWREKARDSGCRMRWS